MRDNAGEYEALLPQPPDPWGVPCQPWMLGWNYSRAVLATLVRQALRVVLHCTFWGVRRIPATRAH